MNRLFAEPKRPEPKAEVDTCPVHWNKVKVLPQGPHPLRDSDGSGAMYRHKHNNDWWLLRYLPPYDGRVSAMGAVNQCFKSLEAFMRYLDNGR